MIGNALSSGLALGKTSSELKTNQRPRTIQGQTDIILEKKRMGDFDYFFKDNKLSNKRK